MQVKGPNGERSIPLVEFYRLPENMPQLETNLRRGELITAVDVPAAASDASGAGAVRSHYLKVRDRNSFAFALVRWRPCWR